MYISKHKYNAKLVISTYPQVPEVTRVDYQLIDISEDGFVRVGIMLHVKSSKRYSVKQD
jgi:hypothetical protein